MITGALMGFLAGVGFGLLRANSWPLILTRASSVAFCCGLLMRWWGRVWLSNFQQSHLERAAAAGLKTPSIPAKP